MPRLADKSLFGLIHDFFKVYLPNQRRCSPHTIAAYRQSLEQLIDYVKGKNRIPIQDVTFEMLDAASVLQFLDALEAERGCSISTRNHRLTAIRSFFSYAAMMDVTVVAFLADLKKISVKKPVTAVAVKHMSEDAIKAILAQPDMTTDRGLRDRFFMILLYDTGARMQEMIDTRLRDLRLGKTPTIVLRGKGGKARTVPLMDRTVDHLRQYLDVFHRNCSLATDEHLFYVATHGQRNPPSHDCIGKFLKKYGEMAGKICREVPSNVHCHLWRHSRAMHLYQNGMDLTMIAQWLGHANLESVLIYAHADTEHKRKAIAAATQQSDTLRNTLDSSKFTITDEDQLKRLYGLR
jgi:site-specific recombinase XerD